MDDGITVAFGLFIWVFAIMGFVMGGKRVLRWYTGMVASDPDGFRKRMGIESMPEGAPMMPPPGPFGGVSR